MRKLAKFIVAGLLALTATIAKAAVVTGPADYIRITNSLQPNATYYVSSGTVNTYLHVLGTTTLSGDRMVANMAPSNGQILTWDSANSYWKPATNSAGGSGTPALAVGTGTASSFVYNASSPTAVISFLGTQFASAGSGTTNIVSLAPSVTLTNNTSTNTLRLQGNANAGIGYWDGAKGGILLVDKQSVASTDGLVVISSQATQSSIDSLAHLVSLTTSYNEIMLWIQSNSTSTIGANADIRIDANNPDIELQETDMLSAGTGNGKWEIAVNFDQFQINQRNTSDSSFQTLLAVARDGSFRYKELDNGGDYVGFIATTTLTNSYVYKLPSDNPSDGASLHTHSYSNGYYDMYWTKDIQNTNTLQTGATFFVSAGRITTPLGSATTSFILTQNDTSAQAVRIISTGTANTVYLEDDGDAGSGSASGGAIFVNNTFNPGIALQIYSNNANPTSNNGMVFFKYANTGATKPLMRMDNFGTGPSIKIVELGNKGNTLSTSGSILVDNSQNPGIGVQIYSSTGSATGALLHIMADSTTWASPLAVFESTSANSTAVNLRLKDQNPDLEFQEIDQASPAGKYKIDVQGDQMRFLARSAADNSYELFAKFNPIRTGMFLELESTGTLRLNDADNSRYVQMRASDTVVNNLTFVLPASLGPTNGVMTSDGAGNLSLQALNVASMVTSTLPVANGGTGAASFTSGQVLFGNGTGAIQSTAPFRWDNTNQALTVNNYLNVGSSATINGPVRVVGLLQVDGSGLNVANFNNTTGGPTRIQFPFSGVNGWNMDVYNGDRFEINPAGGTLGISIDTTNNFFRVKNTASSSDMSLIFQPAVNIGTLTWSDSSNQFSTSNKFVFNSSMTLSGGRLVQDVAPSDGQVLSWSAANSRWQPATSSGGGSSIYAATATASFPFGFSASTAVLTGDFSADNGKFLAFLDGSGNGRVTANVNSALFSGEDAFLIQGSFAGGKALTVKDTDDHAFGLSSIDLRFSNSLAITSFADATITGSHNGNGDFLSFNSPAGLNLDMGNFGGNGTGFYLSNNNDANGDHKLGFGTSGVSSARGYITWNGGNSKFTIDGNIELLDAIQENAQGEVRFADSDSSNYVGFKASATVSANKIWVLPAADGSSGQALTTDGAGVLSFATISGGSGSSIYGATSTASFPFGFSASTADFSTSILIGNGITGFGADWTKITAGSAIDRHSNTQIGSLYTDTMYGKHITGSADVPYITVRPSSINGNNGSETGEYKVYVINGGSQFNSYFALSPNTGYFVTDQGFHSTGAANDFDGTLNVDGNSTFGGSASVTGSLIANSTFSVQGSTIILRGATYYIDALGTRPAGNRILQSDSSGVLTWVTDQTGGGTSTLWGQYNEAVVSNTVSTITTNGVIKSSVTASSKYAIFLNYDTTQFSNVASTFTANSSTFTLQGNTFNGASQLLQLDGSALVPSANIPTNLSAYVQNRATLQSGATSYTDFIYNGSSASLKGVTLNDLSASLPVKTDANKKLTAAAINLSGSEVTGVLASGSIPTNLTAYVQNSATLQSGSTSYTDFIYNGSSASLKGVTLNDLSASLPIKTDSNKKLTAAAINLSGSEVTGVLASGSIPTNLTAYVQNSATLQAGSTSYTDFIYNGSSASLKGVTLNDLSASLPVKTDANKKLTAAAISLSGSEVTNTLVTTKGGTGIATYTQGDILYSDAADSLAKLAKNTTATRYLANTGTSNNPAWAQIDLSNGVTGTLQSANFPTLVGDVSNSGLTITVIDDSHNHTVATSTFAVTGGTFTVTGGTTSFNGIAYRWPNAVPSASQYLQAGAISNNVYPLSWSTPAGSGDAVLAATQTWSGSNVYLSSSQFKGPVLDATDAGTAGKFFGSNGPGTAPSWQTPASGGGYAVEPTTVTFKFRAGIDIAGDLKTADYTITSTDTVILASSTANTQRNIKLPLLVVTSSQVVTITKVDISSAVVVVLANTSPDLIYGTTTQIYLYAPGQSVTLQANKKSGSWWPIGRVPTTPPSIGVSADPNGAAIVVASTTYCHAEYVPDFVVMSAVGVDVAAQALQTQVGIYDNFGNVISTSAMTTIGTGKVSISLAQNAYLSPGTVWICIGSQSATTSFTRRSTGGGEIGTCSFATSLPMATSKTFAGCTSSANDYQMYGLIAGGVR